MKYRPHNVIVSVPQRRILQYHGVHSTTRLVHNDDLPLRFKIADGHVLFNNRALLPFANYLGRLKVETTPEDDREAISKFAYYCSKNRGILLSKWAQINAVTQRFFQVGREERSREFAEFARANVLKLLSSGKSKYTGISGDGYIVDCAACLIYGADGFDESLEEWRKESAEIKAEFDALEQSDKKLHDELLEGAKTWITVRDEYNALFDEYEPVDVFRLSKDFRPRKLTGMAYQTVSWMFD